MKYLIVNADDFGLTKGVSDGIIETFNAGIVRSTTMFANSDYFDYSIDLLKKNKGLSVGVHLCLTDGEPILNTHKTIVNQKGGFFKASEFGVYLKNMSLDEIKAEFIAQIEKIKNAGIEITHLDSHSHLHRQPLINDIVSSLSIKYGIGIRKTDNPCLGIKSTSAFTDRFYNETATAMNFKMIIKKYEKVESLELMCHPGKSDIELLMYSRYAKKREIEMQVLKSYEIQTYIKNAGIELISFADLAGDVN